MNGHKNHKVEVNVEHGRRRRRGDAVKDLTAVGTLEAAAHVADFNRVQFWYEHKCFISSLWNKWKHFNIPVSGQCLAVGHTATDKL